VPVLYSVHEDNQQTKIILLVPVPVSHGDEIINKKDLFGTGTVHGDKITNKNDNVGAGTGTVNGDKITNENDKQN